MERSNRSYTYFGQTVSTCPECLKFVQAKLVHADGNVFFHKYCPEHGASRALVSEDYDYYINAQAYSKPGSIPLRFSSKIQDGCPHDCGLCPAHEQHCCHPIIEITDVCNLACPICMADNSSKGFIRSDIFSQIIDNLVAAEGTLENITLSGGEPTLHPEFWELITISDRPEITRVSLVTNGLTIAQDREFCRRLKKRNIYVVLQFDGFDDDIYQKLRGRPLLDVKKRALAHLDEFKIPTQLLYVAARHINEDHIGQVIRLILENDHILSLAIQPLALIGRGGGSFVHDPLDRLTIPGIIRAVENQTGGVLRKEDFFPLPCPNPQCVSLTYLLKLDDGGFVPFPRFADMKKYLHLLSQSATLGPSQETEDALREITDDLWSTAGEIPDSQRIIHALRRAALEMFPPGAANYRELVRASERQAKSIFIHHYMDRFNFDLARSIKCCHHYPRASGNIMPVCTFNLFHRSKENNTFDTKR